MSIRDASFALLAGLTLAAPTAAFASPARPAIGEVERTATAPTPAPHEDAAAYADREAANQKVGDYEGGATVIYFSGVALVALLLLLLLI